MSNHPSTPQSTVDDATLHAYVDSQLPPDQLQAVWHWLVSHPEDALRVQQWRAQATKNRKCTEHSP